MPYSFEDGLRCRQGVQCRKFEVNLAEASAEGASRSCGGGSGTLGAYVFFLGGGGDLTEAAASAASMQFTALGVKPPLNSTQLNYTFRQDYRLVGCLGFEGNSAGNQSNTK